jgi:polysaccharide export outer membrane protein
MENRRVLAALGALVFWTCGAALAQPPPLPSEPNPAGASPAPAKVEAPKVPASAPADATVVPVDPRTYVIGPEDILMIRVWREPDFTGPVAVRPDGKVTMPLIGDIHAEGLTPERLSTQLKDALSSYINQPEVTVSVNQVNSKKYFITGQVNRPGQYPLVVPTRVFDALAGAGGFRDFANTKNIIIVRGDKRIKFNYNEVLQGKKLEQNIFLENGDMLVVR